MDGQTLHFMPEQANLRTQTRYSQSVKSELLGNCSLSISPILLCRDVSSASLDTTCNAV